MTWAKLDDQLHADPRCEAAGLEAMGLWTLATSYMAAYLTDGEITPDRVRRLAGRRAAALTERLISAGWWERLESGNLRLKPWSSYLLSRLEIEAERTRKSHAGRAGAERTNAKRLETGSAGAAPSADGTRGAPDPTPDPTPDQEEKRPPVGPPPGTEQSFKLQPTGEPAPKRRKPETAIPDGWGPSAEHLTLGRSLGFDEARVRREGERFADGARAKDRRYVDWRAAFANWLRNEQKYAEQRGEKVAPLPPPEPPPKPPVFIHRPRFPREPIEQPPPPPTPPEPEPEDDGPEMTPEELRALKDRRLAELRTMDLDRPNGAHDGR